MLFWNRRTRAVFFGRCAAKKVQASQDCYLLGERMVEVNLRSNQIFSFLIEDRNAEMNKSVSLNSFSGLRREKSWMSLADNGICDLPNEISMLEGQNVRGQNVRGQPLNF